MHSKYGQREDITASFMPQSAKDSHATEDKDIPIPLALND